jgi:GNAT superfamily N-acetyltransferase
VIAFATPDDVADVVRIINAAYDRGETGIWLPGWRRTERADVEHEVAAGEIAVARDERTIVGCIRVRRIRNDAAEFGLLSVAPDGWGRGVGRALVDFAEAAYDVDWMQLELLVPHAPHAGKQRLHDWYTRRGYREVLRRDFAAVYPGELLAGPSDLVTYRKSLRAAPAT